MPHAFSRTVLLLVAALSVACTTAPRNTDPYRVETLVSGGPLHGAKGIRFGPDGGLYVCSVYAQTVYRVDVDTGEVTVAVGPPHGTSDDVAFAPDGTMVWTALPDGEIRALEPGGEPYVLADKLPLINPVNYTKDGRLFAAQIGLDRFLEIDTTGKEPPRLIAKGIGHLNSFEINADDQLYGPLAGIGTLARIDLASGEVTPVAEGQDVLSAVELNSRGEIYAVAWAKGNLLHVDESTGSTKLITTLAPPLDNLAIAPDDRIYISQPALGRIVRVDPATGEQTIVIPGNMSIPGGLALGTVDGRETLFVADDFGFRLVDTESGRLWVITDLSEFIDPSAATDIAVNDEVVVISDVTRSRLVMLDRTSGEKLTKWNRIGTPYGIVLTDNGNPVVAEFESGQVIRLNKEDRKARNIVADGLSGPVGLATGGPGILYVTEATAGRVTRINRGDGSKEIISDGLLQPEGVTVMSDGRIAVVEAGRQQVIAIEPETGATTVLATGLPIGAVTPEAPAPVYTPNGIVAGAGGVLYLSSDIDHSLLTLVPR
ncbi:MAG: PQQ-binding-like beta-propeller repeat protein [Gammaproteobacteria bacterium]|nr:PQQ-binding-like beta-propeller repeat protein [Gammaproteobacteria bacterium]